MDPIPGEAVETLWPLPRAGNPGSRPVEGITGDLYTHMSPVGNAGLFDRLARLTAVRTHLYALLCYQ